MIRFCLRSSVLPVAALLCLVANLITTTCWAWQSTGPFLDLRPGYFHVMVDIRSGISKQDKPLLSGRRVQAAGVDSFLVAENDYQSLMNNNNDDEKKLSDSEVVTDSHYRPLSERIAIDRSNSDACRLWELSDTTTNNEILTTTSSPTLSDSGNNLLKEVFVLLGDDGFVIQAMNEQLGSGAMCLWRPPSSVARTLLSTSTGSTSTNPISVWRLRSNPGIMGIVLDWQDIREVCLQQQQQQQQQTQNEEDILDIAPIYASLKKMRKPCSAMDYPPTIYMIGEDEVN